MSNSHISLPHRIAQITGHLDYGIKHMKSKITIHLFSKFVMRISYLSFSLQDHSCTKINVKIFLTSQSSFQWMGFVLFLQIDSWWIVFLYFCKFEYYCFEACVFLIAYQTKFSDAQKSNMNESLKYTH